MKFIVDIKNGKIIPRTEDFNKNLQSLEDKVCFVDITDVTAKQGKEQIFAYYNGVFLPVATNALRDRGYNVDDSDTDKLYYMKLFGKDRVYNPLSGTDEDYIDSKSNWTKKRLVAYLEDCIIHLAEEFGIEAPDSTEYLRDLEKQKKLKSLRILNAKKYETD